MATTATGDHAGLSAESASGFRITHVGGPTVLIEVGGLRLLTDPAFTHER